MKSGQWKATIKHKIVFSPFSSDPLHTPAAAALPSWVLSVLCPLPRLWSHWIPRALQLLTSLGPLTPYIRSSQADLLISPCKCLALFQCCPSTWNNLSLCRTFSFTSCLVFEHLCHVLIFFWMLTSLTSGTVSPSAIKPPPSAKPRAFLSRCSINVYWTELNQYLQEHFDKSN